MPLTSSILITGGTSGLGYSTALSLAKSLPTTQIIIASRSSWDAAEKINAEAGNNNVIYLPLDLTTHEGVRKFVKAYQEKSLPPLKALVLNAAIQHVDKVHFTEDGLETMFATNHVNHTLLFFLLKQYLTNDARIVVVSSSTHDPKLKRAPPPTYTTGDEAAHPPTGRIYDTQNEGFRRYALSKLCNILFAYALDRHAKAAGKSWVILALDPGVMATNLYRWSSWFSWALSLSIAKWFISGIYTTEEVAETLGKMTVSPEFGEQAKSGRYYEVVDAKELESSQQSHDLQCQDDLWEWTIKEVAKDQEEEAQFRRL
ncbi:uncharacterized protein I303_105531 [Kwoniella dejecticola CBS 10117]|uniref:Dehydrogenase/reductase n=1 Tax=Kwoniella dejecticola CBS 10117 TaxID=1296121 RepID=A0A1A6A281_9TREE|nr:uncharacterized protein I303_05027 [Kwoniella dejecticola CBS 10117]OBR84170.1 hypothetical protein I303_05027 [Kwoniella dejecticola CBS 10117]